MKSVKKMAVCSLAAAIVATGSMAIAQDDLDDLLMDLESPVSESVAGCTGAGAVVGAVEEQAEVETVAEVVAPAVEIREESVVEIPEELKMVAKKVERGSKIQARADGKKNRQNVSESQKTKRTSSVGVGKTTKPSNKSTTFKSNSSSRTRTVRGAKGKR